MEEALWRALMRRGVACCMEKERLCFGKCTIGDVRMGVRRLRVLGGVEERGGRFSSTHNCCYGNS